MTAPSARVRGVSLNTTVVVGLVSGSHFINHMYLVLLPPIFGILAADLDATLAELGLAVGIMSLFAAMFQLPFGYLSDNYSRPLTLGIGLGLTSAGALVLATAQDLAWLLVGQAVVGTGIAAHHPAHFPLLSEATAEDNRGKAFSVHGFAGNLGYAASPALIVGVLALPGLDWRDAFVGVAVVGGLYGLLAMVTLGRLLGFGTVPIAAGGTPDARLGELIRRGRANLAVEFRAAMGSPVILALALLALVSATAAWGIRSFAVVLLTDGYALELGLANTTLTAMFVAGAVLILVGGILSDRISAEVTILVSYGLLAVCVAVVAALLLPPLAAMAFVVAAGGALTMGTPARSKLADKLSASGDLGKNFAIITIGTTAGGAVAPPVFGAIIDASGVGAAFFVVAGLALLSILVVIGIFQWGDTSHPAAPGTADD